MLKRVLILLVLALTHGAVTSPMGRTSILWSSGTWMRFVPGWSKRSESF